MHLSAIVCTTAADVRAYTNANSLVSKNRDNISLVLTIYFKSVVSFYIYTISSNYINDSSVREALTKFNLRRVDKNFMNWTFDEFDKVYVLFHCLYVNEHGQ